MLHLATLIRRRVGTGRVGASVLTVAVIALVAGPVDASRAEPRPATPATTIEVEVEGRTVRSGPAPDPHVSRLATNESDGAGPGGPGAGDASPGHDHARPAAAPLPGTVTDAWSPASTFRTADGWFASPIHATLLPDQRILFVGIARETDPPDDQAAWRRIAWTFTPPPLGAPIPSTTTITELAEPVELDGFEYGTVWRVNDDLYCMGATLTHDGRVVTAGGTRTVLDLDSGVDHTLGLPYETIFDGTSWVRQPGTMLGTGLFGQPTRWYPTVTRLPDRRTLVTGGLEIIVGPEDIGFSNRTVETYDTDTGERTLFSDLDQTPTAMQARDYAHVFVLPYASAPYDVLTLGEPGVPLLARTTEPGAWLDTGLQRPGEGGESTNWGASSALLPLRTPNGEWGYVNGSVLTASGDMHTPFERRADVFDPLFGWRPPLDLGAPRHHPSTVLLPDSRTLIVNGHDMAGGVGVQQAHYIDPANGFIVRAGTEASGVTRGYHSIALLLPDGRVLVSGGRDADTKTSLEKPTYQIYSPDYLRRTRPVITSAPTSIGYDALFGIGVSGPVPSEVMLLALGSMTHSFDVNQRAVELPMGYVPASGTTPGFVVAGSPADTHLAPPGHYLLVVLDAARTPSTARVVHLT